MNKQISVKVGYEGDLRRFQLESLQYEDLERKIRELYGIQGQAQGVRIRFTDPESDSVTIASDAGLLDAIACCDASNTLRLTVEVYEISNKFFCFPEYECASSDHLTSKPSSSCSSSSSSCSSSSSSSPSSSTHSSPSNPEIEQVLIRLAAAKTRLTNRRAALTQQSQKVNNKVIKLTQRSQMLDQKIEGIFRRYPSFAAMFPDMFFQSRMSVAEQDSSGVWCDGCNVAIPKSEIRYKCVQCFDFDLCERCEAVRIHDPCHPLIKMTPEARVQVGMFSFAGIESLGHLLCREFETIGGPNSTFWLMAIIFLSLICSFFSAYALASALTSAL